MTTDVTTNLPGQLRAAAALIRERAKHTTTGPWYEDGIEAIYAYGAPGSDVQWAAALGPQVAEPLAGLLDAVATNWKTTNGLVRAEAINLAEAYTGADR